MSSDAALTASPCCPVNLAEARDPFRCDDGDVWTCPVCGRTYLHVCDEAEGCAWWLAEGPPADRAGDRPTGGAGSVEDHDRREGHGDHV